MIKTKKAPKAPKGKGFKLQAKPLTEELIQKFISHYNEFGSFPGQKIPCTVTGKLTTCVGPWLRKKVKTEKPPGKKGRKKSFSKIVIEDRTVYDIPKIDLHTGPRPLSSDEISECSLTSCFRPDLFLNNDRSCNGCQYYDLCKNANRNLKTAGKKLVRRK